MVQGPSWEANWFAASQEIPLISRNPKVHYRTHKRPPPVPILGQPNPVHIPTSHLLEIHPDINHPSTPRSPQWSPPLRFPQQDPINPPLLNHMRHMPSPSHYSRFYDPHNILSELRVITFCVQFETKLTKSWTYSGTFIASCKALIVKANETTALLLVSTVSYTNWIYTELVT